MKGSCFFDVIEENNVLGYAAFCLKIKWNVSTIAGSENADGYIVQRIHYTDTVGATPPVDDYYEAWLVHRGICVGSSNYDDAFSLDVNYSERPICRSLGKQGSICYDAKVYWVDKNHPLYKIVDSWEKYSTPMAGNLKSVFVSDCPVFEDVEPHFTRKFEHKFDCRSDEAVELALRQAYEKRINRRDPNLRGYLQDILAGSKYIQLIDKLCPPV